MLNRFVCVFLLIVSFIFVFNGVVYASDTVPPTTTLSPTPSLPNGDNGWYTSFPLISISALDAETGVREIDWKINNGDWTSAVFTEGLNLILNSSFEDGYINNWKFIGDIFAIGYKSSFMRNSGSYSGGIINLNYSSSPYWENTHYIEAVPLENYKYSFYTSSITSFLDNGFYDIVSIAPDGQETTLVSVHSIDLKLNFKKYSGTFTTTSVPGSQIIIRIGIEGLGHLSIDDVSISLAGENTSVEFSLDQEGKNTIWYYAKDGAGNIEDTKQSILYVDTLPPSFSNFKTYNSGNTHKFSSYVDVTDGTSGLVSNPTLFNYSVDGFNSGYYSDYGNCAGTFVQNDYLVINNDFSKGSQSGTVSTPIIDYCDSNWVNCKRLNFYVKDVAGNVGDNSICVNGPYIATKYGDVFGRASVWNMGIGDVDNIQGSVVSSGDISDISASGGVTVSFYNHTYLNDLYSKYADLLSSYSQSVDNITTSSGVYSLVGPYTISTPLAYTDTDQEIFVKGDLRINSEVTSSGSTVFYLVDGDIYISNSVSRVDAVLISTHSIYTALDSNLSTNFTLNGSMLAKNINFVRNTDKTLGPSEIINFPLNYFTASNKMEYKKIYWKEY